MKIFLIGLLVLGSATIFAEDSDFERGYQEGKLSCEVSKEAWYCDFSYSKICNSGNYGTGKSRADAILNIYGKCLSENLKAGKEPECKKL
jgi:hypothetical protein